jgi:hypothetical protein
MTYFPISYRNMKRYDTYIVNNYYDLWVTIIFIPLFVILRQFVHNNSDDTYGWIMQINP